MSAEKILIAEDDTNMVKSLKTLLENNDFSVVTTENPNEVINLARNERPSLIILDVIFEGFSGPDGFELSRKLAHDNDLKSIPVIILSGVKKIISSDFVVEPDSEWLPVATFLDKPVKPEELLNEINNLITKRS